MRCWHKRKISLEVRTVFLCKYFYNRAKTRFLVKQRKILIKTVDMICRHRSEKNSFERQTMRTILTRDRQLFSWWNDSSDDVNRRDQFSCRSSHDEKFRWFSSSSLMLIEHQLRTNLVCLLPFKHGRCRQLLMKSDVVSLDICNESKVACRFSLRPNLSNERKKNIDSLFRRRTKKEQKFLCFRSRFERQTEKQFSTVRKSRFSSARCRSKQSDVENRPRQNLFPTWATINFREIDRNQKLSSTFSREQFSLKERDWPAFVWENQSSVLSLDIDSIFDC